MIRLETPIKNFKDVTNTKYVLMEVYYHSILLHEVVKNCLQ